MEPQGSPEDVPMKEVYVRLPFIPASGIFVKPAMLPWRESSPRRIGHICEAGHVALEGEFAQENPRHVLTPTMAPMDRALNVYGYREAVSVRKPPSVDGTPGDVR